MVVVVVDSAAGVVVVGDSLVAVEAVVAIAVDVVEAAPAAVVEV
jgi:hypothetical protein